MLKTEVFLSLGQIKAYAMDTKLLKEAFIAIFRYHKWWLALYFSIGIFVILYPSIIRFLGIVTEGTSPLDQVTLVIEILILVIMLFPPIFEYLERPHIVLEHYVEPWIDDPSQFWLGWRLHNEGRTPASDVSVRIRFVLHTGKLDQFVDKEFNVISHENFLPPSGHQPEYKIRMRCKQGEDKFGLLLETKEVEDNIIQRSGKWYPLPILRQFGLSGLMYWVIITLDSKDLRDEDKALKKYSLIFGEGKPSIELLKSEVTDFLKNLEI